MYDAVLIYACQIHQVTQDFALECRLSQIPIERPQVAVICRKQNGATVGNSVGEKPVVGVLRQYEWT